MVSYYNPSNMYRHQQAVATPTSNPMHTWYTNYHQSAQMPPEQQLWEPQMWHHHHHGHIPPHPVFNNEYQDFMHTGMMPNEGMMMSSPTIHASGSEASSPGIASGNGHVSPNQMNAVRPPPPVRSPFEWIKKMSYKNATTPGKTRTKDKYRVVYTDLQRIELEKEFTLFNRYITLKRKSELAQSLGLSERQVKIWFQNRRAKERKQAKKQIEEKNQAGGFYQPNMQRPPQSNQEMIVGFSPPEFLMQQLNEPIKKEFNEHVSEL